MKQYTEVIKDSFIDYAGKKHYFVIAAISEKLENHNITTVDGIFAVNEGDINKCLKLGISICNPMDEFDEKVGTIKAISRAKNAKPSLYVSDSGLINTTMVRGLLSQEAAYIKNNPEKYIKGYVESRNRYLKNKEMEDIRDNFSEVEKIIVDNMQKDPRFLDDVTSYLNWLNNQECKK